MFWCALDFLLFVKMDQRNCIKFYVKNENKCAGTFGMLTMAFMSRTQVQLWHNQFEEGREMSMMKFVMVARALYDFGYSSNHY